MGKDYKDTDRYRANLNSKNDRYCYDLEFRQKIKERNREYYHRKKREMTEKVIHEVKEEKV